MTKTTATSGEIPTIRI